MGLRLYNTLTRTKEDFVPIDPARVRIYVCGPTVYDFAHIGNARPVIVFDVLFRLLRHLYGAEHVTYVRNITDVDDKINERAAKDFPDLPLNEAIRRVTEATGRQFHDDVDALGALRPSHEPRATEHIEGMKAIIEALIAGGFAYVAEDHVLFSPAAMDAANGALPRYGKLANRTLDEMMAGARVDVAPYKRDAMDFVLWKPSKPGEPAWPSPAGIARPGRPGWHIECSAMSKAYLGETFDIHGGGIDLVFPHHENEIAQSCCAHRTARMANYWLHNGFLQVEGEKMSKSLGNFVTIRELLDDWPGDVIRLTMLKSHYRQPMDWTERSMEESRRQLLKWNELNCDYNSDDGLSIGDSFTDTNIVELLNDDLNTHGAMTRLEQIADLVNRGEMESQHLAQNMRALGFRNVDRPGSFDRDFGATIIESGPQPSAALLRDVRLFRNATSNGEIQTAQVASQRIAAQGFTLRTNRINRITLANETGAAFETRVKALIDQRSAARAARNWAESDRLRDEIQALGVTLKDSKEGTTWEVTR